MTTCVFASPTFVTDTAITSLPQHRFSVCRNAMLYCSKLRWIAAWTKAGKELQAQDYVCVRQLCYTFRVCPI